MRICGSRELAELAPWCPSVWAWPAQWSEAAALAAAEMAIVCHIWSDPLNEVLRPAGIAGKMCSTRFSNEMASVGSLNTDHGYHPPGNAAVDRLYRCVDQAPTRAHSCIRLGDPAYLFGNVLR